MKANGDFEYFVWSSGDAVSIDRYVGTEKHVVIPSKIDGLPVKDIDSGAFMATDIESVIIPDSVEAIGWYAFRGCQELQTVTLSANLKKIEMEAFMSCKSLTSIHLPSGLQEIGGKAFQESGLTSVTIPNTVTKIGNQAFLGAQLTSLTFEDGIQAIGGDAAFWCGENLLSVTIPASVTELGERLFDDELKEIHFLGDAPQTIGYSAIYKDTVIYYNQNASGWDDTSLRESHTLIPE